MTLAACGIAYHVAGFIDYGKYLLLIVHINFSKLRLRELTSLRLVELMGVNGSYIPADILQVLAVDVIEGGEVFAVNVKNCHHLAIVVKHGDDDL